MATATATTERTRLDKAMRQAFHNLDMAEQRQQPAHVLDRFEAAYFAALARFETYMRGNVQPARP